MIKAGILGATGYAGLELTRLLLRHPQAQVAAVGSVSFEGKKLYEGYPSLREICGLECKNADAVLAAYPQIDRTKVCETGGSYGGFMTNWIIGHTDRFVCAASQRSIANWLSFYGVSDIGVEFAKDQCDADPISTPDKMWEHSPMRYAGNVKTPTLFIHSDEDYRCPLAEGLQMYTSLAAQGFQPVCACSMVKTMSFPVPASLSTGDAV